MKNNATKETMGRVLFKAVKIVYKTPPTISVHLLVVQVGAEISTTNQHPLPFEHQICWLTDHLIERLAIQWTHWIDLEVGEKAGPAERVTTGRVQWLDERLQADLAGQILIHLLAVK